VARRRRRSSFHGQPNPLREHWIDQRLARKFVNATVCPVVRIWRWGAAEELTPASTWDSLRAVAGLRAVRPTAREPAKKGRSVFFVIDRMRENGSSPPNARPDFDTELYQRVLGLTAPWKVAG